MNKNTLNRSLSKTVITFYGLGTILGAGIYVLIGKVVAKAGLFAPLSFLIACFIAFFTAVSYAELSGRFPQSAGEALYVYKGFNQKWLAIGVGWLVIFTGVVSAAVLTRGFVGYLNVFVTTPNWLSMLLLIAFMGAIAIYGIHLSALLVMIITIVEIGGLLIIIYLARSEWTQIVSFTHFSDFNINIIPGILSAAFIAFYAFIGFEDIVNVAEEVKHPERNIPFAIFTALLIAAILYWLVTKAVLAVLPINEITESAAPLASFIKQKGYNPMLISLISLIAIINGAIVQLIMASRVLYGMASKHHAPRLFAKINPWTKTPIEATVLIMVIILSLALWFDIVLLAKLTSGLIICVFILIHLALIRLKITQNQSFEGHEYSIIFPIIGVFLSFIFLLLQLLPYSS